MRAGIYARKSTDENDRHEDNKSVTRQVEHSRAFIMARGWVVNEDCVFVDDGVSGAEYQNRQGFNRLLTRLSDIDVLVMSEPSRFGRDMFRNTYYIGEMIEGGVRVFYYLTNEEERLDTPEQKMMVSLRSYASEVERQKASQRSRDALERKATHGYNTGGRVFGYDNVWVLQDGKRMLALPGNEVRPMDKLYTDYQINKQEAKAVQSIFVMYADGYGPSVIAKTLNADPQYPELSSRYFGSATPPRPQKGVGFWSPTAIRDIVRRERYIGVVPFGEYRKTWKMGTQVRVKQDTFHRIDRPDLRIVGQVLWDRVQSRLRGNITRSGHSLRHVPQRARAMERGRVSKYLCVRHSPLRLLRWPN